QQYAQHLPLEVIPDLHFKGKYTRQVFYFLYFISFQFDKHGMAYPIEKEDHTSYFFIVVEDTIKLTVKLPGHQLFGPLELEVLIGHQGQDTRFRHRVGHLVDFYLLRRTAIVDKGVDRFRILVSQASARKQLVVIVHDETPERSLFIVFTDHLRPVYVITIYSRTKVFTFFYPYSQKLYSYKSYFFAFACFPNSISLSPFTKPTCCKSSFPSGLKKSKVG